MASPTAKPISASELIDKETAFMDITLAYTPNIRALSEQIKELLQSIYSDVSFKSLNYVGPLNDRLKKKLDKHRNAIACLIIVSEDLQQQLSGLQIWTYFWANNIPCYILTLQESVALFPLYIRNTSLITLDDTKEVEILLDALQRLTGIKVAVEEQARNVSLLLYRFIKRHKKESSAQLFGTSRSNDHIHYQSALAFYSHGDLGNVIQSASNIQSDSVKYNLIRQIRTKDLALICDIADTIVSSDKIRFMIVDLIQEKNVDPIYLHRLIDNLKRKNQAELRNIAIYLINHRRDDTPVFSYLINSIDNMAEFRKVSSAYISINKTGTPEFRVIIRRFIHTNRAELRKVAIEMIEHGLQKTKEFQFILEILEAENTAEYKKAIQALKDIDLEIYTSYPLHPRQYIV
jgi:hypothetical protein